MNFSESLEHDMSRLTSEVKVRGETAERVPDSRELVKQSLETFKDPSSSVVPSPVTSSTSPSHTSLPSYLQNDVHSEAVKQEVEVIVARVFTDGVSAVLREAQHHSPFVQDAVHDALVDIFLPELKKRGIIHS